MDSTSHTKSALKPPSCHLKIVSDIPTLFAVPSKRDEKESAKRMKLIAINERSSRRAIPPSFECAPELVLTVSMPYSTSHLNSSRAVLDVLPAIRTLRLLLSSLSIESAASGRVTGYSDIGEASEFAL